MAEKKTTETVKFTKAQFFNSKKYAGKQDLISALLADNKTYTTAEVDELIEKYLKGTVK